MTIETKFEPNDTVFRWDGGIYPPIRLIVDEVNTHSTRHTAERVVLYVLSEWTEGGDYKPIPGSQVAGDLLTLEQWIAKAFADLAARKEQVEAMSATR